MSEHYLKGELYDLVRSSDVIFDFLQAGSLDGIWYWDLESPDNEWMSPRFWEVLGYNPEAMPHTPDAWQDLINQDDLRVALHNFEQHCKDPQHPYSQYVRYTHSQGHTIVVHCRGIVIRDGNGKPVRMLGAHVDVTPLMEALAGLREIQIELGGFEGMGRVIERVREIEQRVLGRRRSESLTQEQVQALLSQSTETFMENASHPALQPGKGPDSGQEETPS